MGRVRRLARWTWRPWSASLGSGLCRGRSPCAWGPRGGVWVLWHCLLVRWAEGHCPYLQMGGDLRADEVPGLCGEPSGLRSSFQGGVGSLSSLFPQHPDPGQDPVWCGVGEGEQPQASGCFVPQLVSPPFTGSRQMGWGGSCLGGPGDGGTLPLLFSVLGHRKA